MYVYIYSMWCIPICTYTIYDVYLHRRTTQTCALTYCLYVRILYMIYTCTDAPQAHTHSHTSYVYVYYIWYIPAQTHHRHMYTHILRICAYTQYDVYLHRRSTGTCTLTYCRYYVFLGYWCIDPGTCTLTYCMCFAMYKAHFNIHRALFRIHRALSRHTVCECACACIMYSSDTDV